MAIIFLINKRIENIQNLVSMKTQQILHDRLCMSLFLLLLFLNILAANPIPSFFTLCAAFDFIVA